MTSAAPRTVDDPDLGRLLAWWTAEQRALPWRASRDPYAIWVSEVMSAQTQVGRAAEAWERWMARWPTVDALAGASLHAVLREWQGLGYPRRARDLHRGARIVHEQGWPADLTELPGVGAYVAAAIRCFAREEPVLPLDVNVTRVLARRFPEGVDPTGDPWRTGQAMMEFGQRICQARAPRCGECPVAADCHGPDLGNRSDATPARPRPARRQAPYAGSLRQRRGQLLRRVLAEQRVPVGSADAITADSLLADGLIVADGDWLLAPA